MKISTIVYKHNISIYKASIVDLTLATLDALNHIDLTTPFGGEFMKIVGSQIKDFIDEISGLYESYNITDSRSQDYRTSYNFWFSEIPLKRKIKFAELYLGKAMHKLNLLVNVLVIQMRQRVYHIKKVHMVSSYVEQFIDSLDKVMGTLPEQQQKEIIIKDKHADQTQEDQTKVITITYEPFVEYINAAFNEAAKAKRFVREENREVNDVTKKVVREDKESNEKHERPKKKQVNVEPGWKIQKR